MMRTVPKASAVIMSRVLTKTMSIDSFVRYPSKRLPKVVGYMIVCTAHLAKQIISEGII